MIKIKLGLMMSLFAKHGFAEALYKPEMAPKQGWFIYSLLIAGLAAIAFILAKTNKKRLVNQENCLVIDKKRLGAKTIIYVLEYQNQQFLLADNQHALALHALKKENVNA
jgi:hypothetical protein